MPCAWRATRNLSWALAFISVAARGAQAIGLHDADASKGSAPRRLQGVDEQHAGNALVRRERTSKSKGLRRPAPAVDVVSLTNVAAGGLQMPIGNALQFLMNALIFAEAAGKKGVAVGGKVKTALMSMLDFGDGVIEVDSAHQNASADLQGCGDLSGSAFEGCRVPLHMRREVALKYLTPRLKPVGCLRKQASMPELVIHVRSNEWCCDNPMYVQPPCALYDEILKRGNFGKPYRSATVYGDIFARAVAFPDVRIYKKDPSNADHPPWSNPCMKDLLERSFKNEVGGANITASSGQLLDDVCDLISAPNVVLAASTFASNLVLLNPRSPRLFVPLPSMEFPYELFRFHGRVEGNKDIGPKDMQAVERYMEEVREVFPGSIGYQMSTKYLEEAKRTPAGEMLARVTFASEFGWRRIPS